MSYIALYRKWRPVTFDDVVEQSSVVSILKNAVKQDRIGHAYLFCGTRGTGKTTIAKIFSRAINCLEPKDGNPCNECDVCKGILNQSLLDVIEIDAASNNGVDNIRDIIEEIAYVPARARYKVYIIDEVHMLSTGAFNALLKTLEEPPSHAVFLLATTDPQKLPATILSRCQRFEFKRINADSIVKRLELICGEANKKADKDALYYIAQAADGALRDAISILDQCISTGKDELKLEDVLDILGVASEQFLAATAEAIVNKDVDKLLLSVDQMVKEGKEIPDFISGLIVFFRNMLVMKAAGDNSYVANLTPQTLSDLKNISASASNDQLIGCIKELSSLERDIKWATQKKIILEVGLIKLCITEPQINNAQAATLPNVQTNTTSINTQKVNTTNANMQTINTTGTSSQTGNATVQDTHNTQPGTSSNKDVSNNAADDVVIQPPPVRVTGLMAKLRPVEGDNLRDIFLDLKENKHMMVMSYLRNVRALYHSDTVIYLIFCGAGKEIKKDSMAKPDNMNIINSVFQKILGRDCAVRLYTEDELSDRSDSDTDQSDVMSRISKLAESGIQVEFE